MVQSMKRQIDTDQIIFSLDAWSNKVLKEGQIGCKLGQYIQIIHPRLFLTLTSVE